MSESLYSDHSAIARSGQLDSGLVLYPLKRDDSSNDHVVFSSGWRDLAQIHQSEMNAAILVRATSQGFRFALDEIMSRDYLPPLQMVFEAGDDVELFIQAHHWPKRVIFPLVKAKNIHHPRDIFLSQLSYAPHFFPAKVLPQPR